MDEWVLGGNLRWEAVAGMQVPDGRYRREVGHPAPGRHAPRASLSDLGWLGLLGSGQPIPRVYSGDCMLGLEHTAGA